MSAAPSTKSLHRFAIAKEMYLEGLRHASRESIVGSILAILNFDYAMETILKATLLDNNIKIEYKPGSFKTFDVLITDLQTIYNNPTLITEVNLLHKLRNDVQHNVVIPSLTEINRHQQTVRLFFQDICNIIYKNSISFESISLSFLIDSEVEKTILSEMETALINNRYDDASHYAKSAVFYHRNLLQEEMKLPHRWDRAHDFQDIYPPNDRYKMKSLGRYLEGLEKSIDWITSKMSLQEYYEEVEQLLGDYPYHFEKGNMDQQKAEKDRTLAYNIITSTQGLLKKKKDSDRPFIFDFTAIPDAGNVKVQLGIASAAKIVEAKLEIRLKGKQEIFKESPVQSQTGLQTIFVEGLAGGQEYMFTLSVKNSEDEAAIDNQSFHLS